MPKVAPFEAHTTRYERWFEEHPDAYKSELEALRRLLKTPGYGIEIGVGSGQFAAPLGIQIGIDPSVAMLKFARERGIEVTKGVAEFLPFRDASFDTVLMVTTICFVDDITRTMAEASRVLAEGGGLVLGFIDRDSPVGRVYQQKKAQNPFYRDAVFVSTDELVEILQATGFSEFEFSQTIYQWPDDIEGIEPINAGYGEGSFVCIKATQS